MKLIFSSFKDYAHANAAIKNLLINGIAAKKVNAIVTEKIIRNRIKLEENIENISNKFSPLDHLIDSRSPLYSSGLGNIYAAGQLALDMVKTAPSITGDGIRSALQSFLPTDVSDFYFTTVQNGGVLVWVESDDETAEKTAVILQEQAGLQTITLE